MAWNHQVTTFLIWTNVHQIITRLLSDAVWHYKGLMSWWSFWVTKKDFMTNELKHWKYLKVIDIMVIPLCPKTPADPILGIHNGACGYACLHGIACHTTISIIWHIKKVLNHVKWGVELKMNWLNWSIPISSGFQFQFNSNSKSFNSIPIQFMLNWIELNWLSIPIQFMNWSEPCWHVMFCQRCQKIGVSGIFICMKNIWVIP